MSAARAEILGRVRSAVAGAPAPAEIPRAYRRLGTAGSPERLAVLCERLADYRADVHRVGPAGLPASIAECLAANGAARIGIPAALPHDWRPAGAELVEDDGLSPAELDRLDGVLTGCTLAIAETGTLVLAADSLSGRRALTLVPDLHVCVVHEEQVVELVPEAMAALAELVRNDRAPLTLVSGPSATSDIELSRVEGVHGPRRLVVIVVSEEVK